MENGPMYNQMEIMQQLLTHAVEKNGHAVVDGEGLIRHTFLSSEIEVAGYCCKHGYTYNMGPTRVTIWKNSSSGTGD